MGAWTTAMSLINFTVYNKCTRKALLPWQISNIHPPTLTFRDHFHQELSERCPSDCSLSEVFVGKAKDALDLVNSDLVILEVTPMFGPCVKYTVDQQSAQDVQVLSLSLTHTHTHSDMHLQLMSEMCAIDSKNVLF